MVIVCYLIYSNLIFYAQNKLGYFGLEYLLDHHTVGLELIFLLREIVIKLLVYY